MVFKRKVIVFLVMKRCFSFSLYMSVVYPGFWGGSTNSVEGRENGDLGAVAP
jgi:hypothetical protein